MLYINLEGIIMECRLHIIDWQMIASLLTIIIAIIAIIPLYRDRRKLRVFLIPGKRYNPDGDAIQEKLIIIRIMNVSRRRMIAMSIAYTFINDKCKLFFWKKPVYPLAISDLPKIIEEGNFHSEFTFNLAKDFEKIKSVFVIDSTGKKWKVKKRNIKRFKKIARIESNWFPLDPENIIIEAKK